MYLWKAWQDSRARIVVYILAALSVGVLSGLEVLAQANYHIETMAMPHRWLYRTSWNFYMLATFEALGWLVIPYAKVAAVLTGLSLGASGVGGEYGAGTMPFVLTRAAARRKLVFTDWTIGLTAIIIVVGSLAFCVFPFLCFVRAQGPGNVLIALPALWVWGAAIYGLASFTTLLAGSASRGLVLSSAVVLTYGFLPDALHSWWHMDALLKARDWTLQFLSYGWFFSGVPHFNSIGAS